MKKHPRRCRQSKRLRHAVGYVAEALESRRLLTIVVNGTSGVDTLSVSRSGSDLHVTLNGNSSTIGIGNEINLQVNGLAGSDTIVVDNVDLLVTVSGGDGNDTIAVGGGDIQNGGDARVSGGAGIDTVILDDSGSAGADSYRLAANFQEGGTLLFKNEGAFPDMSLSADIQTLRLLTNSSANVIDIQDRSNSALTSYDIRSNGGNDICNFERSDGNASIAFDGGSGTDELVYVDDLNSGNQNVVVGKNEALKGGTTVVSWSSTQQVDLTIAGQDDLINVVGVGSGIAVTVHGGDGDDELHVGNNDVDANILGPLQFIGDAGTDNLVFLDSSGAATGPNDSYTLTSSSFAKSGLVNPILFGGIEQIRMNCNAGSNAITLEPGALLSTLIVNANLGDDVITYAAGDIRGPATTLNGSTGDDTIILNDNAAVGGVVTDKDYTIAAGAITQRVNGSTNTRIEYSAESVTLNSGDYDSTFDLSSLGSENDLTLNAGNGTDTLLLSPFATSAQITFNGGGGVDSIDVDDSGDFTLAPTTYTLTKTSFDMVDNFGQNGFGLLSFSSIDSFKLTTNSEGDTININGVASGVATTVIGGFKPDTFNIGNGDIDSNISANLSVVGEQGGDTVILNDVNDTGDDAYRLDGGVFSKANVIPTITYAFVEHVQLNASPGNNSITFVSPGFALDVILRGFAGADTFHITPSAQALLNIEGSDPTVAPGDILQFVNAAPAGSATFTPNGPVNGAYAFASAKTVTFSGIETFPSVLSAPGAPDLDAADDTGISKVDNVTNNSKPVFTGDAPPKVKVELRAASVTLGAGVSDEKGDFILDTVFPADGVYAVQAFALDPTSGLTSPASPPLNVTLDTVAPAAPSIAPDLAASSDSGISSTDNITSDNTPTFSGATAANNIVRLRVGASQVGIDATTSGGTYSITTATLTDDRRNFTVTFEDLAGNVAPISPALEVTIDTVAPASPAAPPDLLASSDTGASNSDNITADNTPQFIESVEAGTIVRLFNGATEIGIDTDTSSGLYDITASPALPEGQSQIAARFEDLAGNFAAHGPALTVNIDTIAPALSLAAFEFATAHQLRFQFSEAIDPTMPVSSLALKNLTAGSTISGDMIAVGSTGSSANFTVPGFSGGILPDGNYLATLAASSVRDTAGNPLVADLAFSFFVLTGDANHDRTVGFADLVAVAQNYGAAAGATFARGDFNYDGQVDFADLVTVAQKYGTTLMPPASAAPLAAASLTPLPPKASSAKPARLGQPIKSIFSVAPIAKPTPPQLKPSLRPKHR